MPPFYIDIDVGSDRRVIISIYTLINIETRSFEQPVQNWE